MPRKSSTATTIDPAEVARFSAMARDWWDPSGPMRPLHKLNPTRLAWIKDQASAHFDRDSKNPTALESLAILDIGCGGGIVSEPLARMGATVTGIDASEEAIAAAKLHAGEHGLAIDYRAISAEKLAATRARFDVVLMLEIVEHVADVPLFVASVAKLAKPGSLVIASTINRTLRAFALAIVAAEYVLRWLPRGTHSYDKLVTPEELSAAFTTAGLKRASETGIVFDPLRDAWRLSSDTAVNYMMAATKPSR
jgi:2-polyprenyl-6-hydroxyphenyl methylase/3-demethylubiquinone-9 3-methyltransferase